MRFQVNGCTVARNVGDPETPLEVADWDWEEVDRVFAQVAAYNSQPAPNMQVIAHLTDAPAWATSRQDGCFDNIPSPPSITPRAERFWRDFVSEFLDRYADVTANGITAVQAWNEPDSPGYWGYDEDKDQFITRGHANPDHFSRLVNHARREVNEFNGATGLGVTLLPGALSPAGSPVRPYIKDMLRDNGASENPPSDDPTNTSSYVPNGSISAWAAHLYSRDDTAEYGRVESGPNEGDIRGARTRVGYQARQIERALEARGEGALPVWITEMGFAAYPRGSQNEPTTMTPEQREVTQSNRLLWALDHFSNSIDYPVVMVHRVLDPTSADPEYRDELAVIRRNLDTGVWTARNAYCDLATRQGLPNPQLPTPPRCPSPSS